MFSSDDETLTAPTSSPATKLDNNPSNNSGTYIKDGERVGRSVQQSEQEDRRQDHCQLVKELLF